MESQSTYNVLGVNIHAVNLKTACARILKWIGENARAYVCFAPVATIIDCHKDPEYRKIVNSSGMTTPDGMPVAWLGRISGFKDVERTYGPDLMFCLSDISQNRGLKHYFYGANEETLDQLIKVLQERFPRIRIAGHFAPPYREKGEEESAEIIDKINSAQPDILWVGLGSPKQDYWMAQHRPKLNVPVMLGVGAAFDFISGKKAQAPQWMRQCGLEWLFRLISEPKRLWRRYFFGNSLFLWFLLKDFFKHIFSQNGSDKKNQ